MKPKVKAVRISVKLLRMVDTLHRRLGATHDPLCSSTALVEFLIEEGARSRLCQSASTRVGYVGRPTISVTS